MHDHKRYEIGGFRMVDHIDIAILMKVNELAGRYGFKPQDFTLTYRGDDVDAMRGEKNKSLLSYDTSPAGIDEVREEAFLRMVDSVGTTDGQFVGTYGQLLDALDNAIARAPAMRKR